MGCNCFTSESLKSEESFQVTDNVSTTVHPNLINRRLFTVREENLESSETKSFSYLD
jgi:hypothetical protein